MRNSHVGGVSNPLRMETQETRNAAPNTQKDLVEEVTILLVEPDARRRADCARELRARGSLEITAHEDAVDALALLRRGPTVAFLPWPLSGPADHVLVQRLHSSGAHVIACVSPDHWEAARDAHREGADDVLLTPCAPEAFAVRALLARDVLTRRRPSPWQRPRTVLRQALAHPTGGDVLVQRDDGLVKVLVARGRVAWVHDGEGKGSLLRELACLGVTIDADDLATVVAECRTTREELGVVLERWGLVDRSTLDAAMRALVNGRLSRALADREAVALFVPSRWQDLRPRGFTTEELDVPHTIAPPSTSEIASVPRAGEILRRARFDEITAAALRTTGCRSAFVLHYGSATVVSAAGEPELLPLAWGLGATLHQSGHQASGARPDAIVCLGERAMCARGLGSEASYFLCVDFDLSVTSLALARRAVAALASLHHHEPSTRRPEPWQT
jgi:CheY-like chemotaxis protein